MKPVSIKYNVDREGNAIKRRTIVGQNVQIISVTFCCIRERLVSFTNKMDRMLMATMVRITIMIIIV